MRAAIQLRGVVLARGGRTILDGLTADIPVGTATAVVGPSGAGKSTLLALVAGLEQPDAGTVVNPFAAARTGVVLQSYGLVRLLTAAENVELALQSRRLPPGEIRERAARELDRFGLAALADRRTDELSGGQQQRLAIARALVIEPDLLVADELTSELDPRNRERTLHTVLGLRHEGVTVVIATHDAAIADACDRRIRVGASTLGDARTAGEARRSTSALALEEQRRRVDAQRAVVDRETARLQDMERALDRLARATRVECPDRPPFRSGDVTR